MAVRKVGSCRIIKELGRGGMGVVYQAEQEPLGRMVAIKELPQSLAVSKDFTQRFYREGRAYAQMSHQAIIAVHDLVEKNDAIYLITEFVDGADLAALVRKMGALPEAAVAIIGAAVADALAHAHFHKVLHRDIKPANIMLSRLGDVKLMDFGIAKDLKQHDLTRDGMVVGSLPFMAPETLTQGTYSQATDIWALGATLYELATGNRPFEGADDGKLMSAIIKARYVHPRRMVPAMSRRVANIIRRCLQPGPAKRWRNAATLAQALRECAYELTGGSDFQAQLLVFMQSADFAPSQDDLTSIDAASVGATVMGGVITGPPKRTAGRWALAAGIAALLGALAGGAWALFTFHP